MSFSQRDIAIAVGASLAAVVVCCGVAVAVFNAGDTPSAKSGPTVTISKCEPRGVGSTDIEITSTSNDIKPHSYTATVRVRDAGGKVISVDDEYINRLTPGETDTDDITLYHEGKTGVKCELVSVK